MGRVEPSDVAEDEPFDVDEFVATWLRYQERSLQAELSEDDPDWWAVETFGVDPISWTPK